MKFQQQQSQKQQQTQKLAMTQQLQQSIQILQYNTEELLTFVESEALENPLIEVRAPKLQSDLMKSQSPASQDNQTIQIPDVQISLFEYVMNQIHLNYRDTFLRKIVLVLAESLDLNGYLRVDEAEVKAQLQASDIQFLDGLTLLQQLDPAGVGARSLQECLMLQTERDDNAPELAYLILEEAFEAIANRQFQQIAKKYQLSLPEVQNILDYIRSLDPFPGASFGDNQAEFIIPDLTLMRDGEKLNVVSNRRGQLKVNFQTKYFERLSKEADEETLQYLKEKQQRFQWLEKTLGQRQDTILTVGEIIVERQKDFFLNQSGALKPLQLKEIAEIAGVHESTISRAVNGKYIETDFGIFELRQFFVNKVNNEDSSADGIKLKIKEMIDQEDKNKPLSDQKLVELLANDGEKLSRRTVAKYRENLKIPSSAKRKRFD
ncbi:RNA polymerase factor sigma-54 [Enterococcus alishanensis]